MQINDVEKIELVSFSVTGNRPARPCIAYAQGVIFHWVRQSNISQLQALRFDSTENGFAARSRQPTLLTGAPTRVPKYFMRWGE
jgi:hypothetical protein